MEITSNVRCPYCGQLYRNITLYVKYPEQIIQYICFKCNKTYEIYFETILVANSRRKAGE